MDIYTPTSSMHSAEKIKRRNRSRRVALVSLLFGAATFWLLFTASKMLTVRSSVYLETWTERTATTLARLWPVKDMSCSVGEVDEISVNSRPAISALSCNEVHQLWTIFLGTSSSNGFWTMSFDDLKKFLLLNLTNSNLVADILLERRLINKYHLTIIPKEILFQSYINGRWEYIDKDLNKIYLKKETATIDVPLLEGSSSSRDLLNAREWLYRFEGFHLPYELQLLKSKGDSFGNYTHEALLNIKYASHNRVIKILTKENPGDEVFQKLSTVLVYLIKNNITTHLIDLRFAKKVVVKLNRDS